MNKRQKKIVRDISTVLIVTAIAVTAMINFKDWVNRSEAIRAMEHLSRIIIQYRQEHGSVPPESYIDGIRGDLQGGARLRELVYRGRWIGFESTPEDILAYSKKESRSLFIKDGYVVLRRNGTVEWMGKNDFETLLAQQQSQNEIEMLKTDL
jgi:type II secretory pathway pseudopilin PulG